MKPVPVISHKAGAASGTTSWFQSLTNNQWFPAFALLAVTLLAYARVWHCGFIWDDDDYVINNVTLRSLDGLRRIWLEPGAIPQYYPLTHTTLWLDFHLWGSQPLGYHVANVLLHALSAVLLWRILGRLCVPGAWLGAALFALHPVVVESVAWVTERKNTLSAVFFLGSLMMSLKFWLPPQLSVATRAPAGEPESTIFQPGPWRFYWLALGLYVCALLSKTAAVGLPGVILLLIWWQRRKFAFRDVGLLAPFFVAGLALGLVTVFVEKYHVRAMGRDWDYSLLQRVLLAGRICWFYLGKLAWPHPLMFMYPHWNISTRNLVAFVPLLAGAIGLALLWRKRDAWGRPVLVAAGYFLAMLFPALGFFNIYPFRFSFVSDHFQYLAAMGPLALAGAGITLGLARFGKTIRLLAPAILLLVLGALTWQQTRIYANLETLWRDTLAQNPDSWMAHLNLGDLLSQQGKVADEIIEYRKALELKPDYVEARFNLGNALLREGKVDEAIAEYEQTLQIDPAYPAAHVNLGNALLQKGNVDAAAKHYEESLQFEPHLPDALNNLAWLLATRPEASHRDGPRAVALAQEANALTHGEDPIVLHSLAAAFAETGKFDDAVRTTRKAIQLAGAAGQPEIVAQLNGDLKRYQAGLPNRQ